MMAAPTRRSPTRCSASSAEQLPPHEPGQRLEHRDDHGHDRDRQADEKDAEPDLAARLVAGDAPGPRAVDRALAQLIAPASFISLIVPLTVFFAFQRYFVQGLLAGSVK